MTLDQPRNGFLLPSGSPEFSGYSDKQRDAICAALSRHGCQVQNQVDLFTELDALADHCVKLRLDYNLVPRVAERRKYLKELDLALERIIDAENAGDRPDEGFLLALEERRGLVGRSRKTLDPFTSDESYISTAMRFGLDDPAPAKRAYPEWGYIHDLLVLFGKLNSVHPYDIPIGNDEKNPFIDFALACFGPVAPWVTVLSIRDHAIDVKKQFAFPNF